MAHMTRSELIRKYPGPYHCTLKNAQGKVLLRTQHDTLNGLEVEVGVCHNRIARKDEGAASYDIEGIPKELALSRHEVRDPKNPYPDYPTA